MFEPRPRWLQKLDPLALAMGRLWFAPFGYVNDSKARAFGHIQLAVFFMFMIVLLIFALASATDTLTR